MAFESLSPIITRNEKYQRVRKRGKGTFWMTVQRVVKECAKEYPYMDVDVTLMNLLDADWESYDTAWDFLMSYDVEKVAPILYECVQQKEREKEIEQMAEEKEAEELHKKRLENTRELLKDWKEAEEEGYLEGIERAAKHLITEYPSEVRELYEEEKLMEMHGLTADESIADGRYGFPAIDFYEKYSSSLFTFMEIKNRLKQIERSSGIYRNREMEKLIKELKKEIAKLRDEIKKKERKEGTGEVKIMEKLMRSILPGMALQTTEEDINIQCRRYSGKVTCLLPSQVEEFLETGELKDSWFRWLIHNDIIKGGIERVVPEAGAYYVYDQSGKAFLLYMDMRTQEWCLYDPEAVKPYIYVTDQTLYALANAIGVPPNKGYIDYLRQCMYHSVHDEYIEWLMRGGNRERADVKELDELVREELTLYAGEHTQSEIDWLERFLEKYEEEKKKCGGMAVVGV